MSDKPNPPSRSPAPLPPPTPPAPPAAAPSKDPAADATFWQDHYTAEVQPDGTTQITLKDAYVAPTALWDTVANLRARDSDGDGLSDFDEYVQHTNPNDADTDHDGRSDSEELAAGFDPTVPNPSNATVEDRDGDGLPDLFEVQYGSSTSMDVGAIVGNGRDATNVPAAYYAAHAGDMDPIGRADLRQRLGLQATPAEQAALDTAVADALASDNPLTQIRGQLAQVGFDQSALDPALVQAGDAYVHDQMAAAADIAVDGGSVAAAIDAMRQDELLGGGNLSGATRAALEQIVGDVLGSSVAPPDSGPVDGNPAEPDGGSLPDSGGTGSSDPPPEREFTDTTPFADDPFDTFGGSTSFDTGSTDQPPSDSPPTEETHATDTPPWQSALDQLTNDPSQQYDPPPDGSRGGEVGPVDLGIDSIHPTTTEPSTPDATQPTTIDFTDAGSDDTGHEGYEVTAVNGQVTSVVHHTQEGDVLYTPGLIERMADDVPATDTPTDSTSPTDENPTDGRSEDDPGGYFATDVPVRLGPPPGSDVNPPPDEFGGDDWGPTGREPQPGWYSRIEPDGGEEPVVVPDVVPIQPGSFDPPPPDLDLGGGLGDPPINPNDVDPYAADIAGTGPDTGLGTDPTGVNGLADVGYDGSSGFGTSLGGDYLASDDGALLTPDADEPADDGPDPSRPPDLFGRDGMPVP